MVNHEEKGLFFSRLHKGALIASGTLKLRCSFRRANTPFLRLGQQRRLPGEAAEGIAQLNGWEIRACCGV